MVQRISSRQNPIVRYFRNVSSGRIPERVLLDGDHLIEEALTSGVDIEVAAFTDDVSADRFASRVGNGTRTLIVSSAVLKALSPVQSPSGSVALAARPHADLERVFARAPQLILLLHEVQDPGNIGAIVRAAEGCSATGIVCSERTADPFGWKALRGSMGSSFRVPVATRQPAAETIASARGKGLRIFATSAHGGTPLPQSNLRMPAVIVLGGEGGGLPAAIMDLADERLTIPMQPPVESLNVAIAAALVTYEAARQRHTDRVHVAV
ncbi:MAG TPA: RNA methyltransferase [Vicinamibacterales bacterium]|nr:RNA methyltransferase [Vicinamibacterales bacterium]